MVDRFDANPLSRFVLTHPFCFVLTQVFGLRFLEPFPLVGRLISVPHHQKFLLCQFQNVDFAWTQDAVQILAADRPLIVGFVYSLVSLWFRSFLQAATKTAG